MNDFNEILENRKSVKGFDPNYKIPHDEMNEIISKATKAPSSVNGTEPLKWELNKNTMF